MPRQRTIRRSSTGEPDGNLGIRWWSDRYKVGRERADACWRWMARIMTRQAMRRKMFMVNMRLYEDMPALSLGPYAFAPYDVGDDTLRMNLIRAVTDTWVPTIGRSQPKPMALTSDGDWALKKRAKGMTRWLEGKWQEMALYRDVSTPCLRDAGVFGMGAALSYQEFPGFKDKTDVACERVFPFEVIADEAEAQNPRNLRTMARRRLMDRQQAADLFPAEADYILNHAPRYGPGALTYDYPVDSNADLIALAQLWRLPTFDEGDDGLNVICCVGRTLYEAKHTRRSFPIKFLYRTRPSQGIWGVSIPTELRGLHVHINTCLLDLEECLRLYGKPKLIYPVGSIDPNAFGDEVDDAIPFTGQQPPIVYSPQVMPPEFYTQLWLAWQKGFEQIGVSSARSQGEIPEGLSGSGASIRAWNDVEDGRLYEASKNFEDFHMQLAAEQVEIARDVAKVRPKYCAAVRGKTTVQLVDFRDVDPKRDVYYWQLYPVSRLSTSPSQRMAQVQEWFSEGIIDKEQYRELLDFPDLESETNLLNAPRDLADKLIDRFLESDDPQDPDVFVYPEPEWPLAALKVRFQYAEIQARLDEAPEDNVELLRRFMQLCDKLLQTAAQPAAPPGGAPAPAPGQPGSAPTQGPAGNPQLAPSPPPLPAAMPGQTAA